MVETQLLTTRSHRVVVLALLSPLGLFDLESKLLIWMESMEKVMLQLATLVYLEL